MNEQISALIDDEIAVDDAAHLIAAVQSNKQAAEAWGQYHLIGDALRGVKAFNPDFKQNLMQKIDSEATVLSPNAALANRSDELKKQTGVKGKITAGWSIAASFAAVVVVGWMAMNQQTQNGDELAPVEMAQSIPAEYLTAHQASAPSASSYYIQSVSYSE
ncbi:MAG TPA: sigma-E factor negative regulatory protein [Methylotenera sp.]|nr:sigma-E factor negative regulatory protein [Methylotenera sp.]